MHRYPEGIKVILNHSFITKEEREAEHKWRESLRPKSDDLCDESSSATVILDDE